MNDAVKVYTKEEFNTEEPYQFLFEHRDSGFTYMQLYNELNANAEKVGFGESLFQPTRRPEGRNQQCGK